MKDILVFALLTLLLCAPYAGADTRSVDSDKREFGQQPILTDTDASREKLIKRVLGTTEYRLTPGDTYELVVQLEDTERTTLILPQDYSLEIPYLGTYDVREMRFSTLRSRIIRDFKRKLPVEYVDFILTSPALFDVFVYGGVENPGIATVTALNRVSEAIGMAKGLKKGASYRMIQLKRGARTITCDLTRFIQEADTSENPLLQPEDRIYIPHPEILTVVGGSVKYPDTYELVPGESLADLIRIAGGILPGAEDEAIEVTRLRGDGPRRHFTVALGEAGGFLIENGDRVSVRSTYERRRETILLEAPLYGKPAEPGKPRTIPEKPVVLTLPYVPGKTLLQVLDDFGGPTPLAEANKSLVIHESGHRVAVNVERLWESRNPDLDVELEPGDHIFIPMRNLKVVVAGQVNDGGAFDYMTGRTVGDYIAAAGGVDLELGDPNRLFVIDRRGNREPTQIDAEVEPGTIVYVDKKAFEHVAKGLNNTLVIVGFVSALVSLTAAIISLSGKF